MPLLNWYREQLLEKLAELDPSKSRQLRGITARKTTTIKALEDLGFHPSSHHGSRQMEGPDNEGGQQQVAFAITALQQQQQQQLQQDGGQERSLQKEIETTNVDPSAIMSFTSRDSTASYGPGSYPTVELL